MTSEIVLTLIILFSALVLFATEKLRVDLIALLVLLAVALTGLVSPEEAFSGFASPAVITVWAVYIVSGGLFKTGVADMLGKRIIGLAGKGELRLTVVIMMASGLMSAFMNNIGAAAILLPAVVGVARKADVPLSKLLIPLSFASLMGGNMTAIGTPPNILASSLLEERGLASLGFFDFLPTGLVVFGSGLLFMALVGRHLLPVRRGAEDEAGRLREYISEVRLLDGSPLNGLSLEKSRLGVDYDLTVLAISRQGQLRTALHRETRLAAGDLLLVEGDLVTLLAAREALGLMLEAESHVSLEALGEEHFHLVEAVLAPRSRMEGRTLKETRFRDRYGFTVLAISRHGEVLTRRLNEVMLRFGDVLLLKGPIGQQAALQDSDQFLVLEPVELEARRLKKAPMAILTMGGVVALTSLAGLPIATAMVMGAVAMVLLGCLSMDEAYQSIEWRSVFLIAGMLPLGMAMQSSGTALFLARQLVDLLGSFGPLAVLAGIYILAGLITEPMSNAAATVLMVPIAIDLAQGMGASPQAFALATVIGASTSFLTPVGHQANVLMFGPGNYRFWDYARAGAPLNLVILIATLIALPAIWPLFP